MSLLGTVGIMQTYSGVEFNLLAPKPGMVRLVDIAHHLSKLDRWNGAAPRPFPVAAHLLFGERGLVKLYPDATPTVRLAFLLHDAHEAYTGDLHRPFKHIPAVREAVKTITKPIDSAISEAFGFVPLDGFVQVNIVDDFMAHTEALWFHKLCPDLRPLPEWVNPLNQLPIELFERNWRDLKSLYIDRVSELCKELGLPIP